MPLAESFEQALSSPDPIDRLRSLALHLSSTGLSREAIRDAFEQARAQLRLANREADEDRVMDVMDFLAGWCSPHMKIPTEATNGTTALASNSEPASPPSPRS